MLRSRSARERLGKRHALPPFIEGAAAFDQAVHRTALDAFAPEAPFLNHQSKIVTIGSCFAGNVARVLNEAGYDVLGLQIRERLFNAFALKDFIGQVAADGDVSTFTEYWGVSGQSVLELRSALKQGAVVIVTLGLSFVWFDNETDEMIFDPAQRVGTNLIIEHPERYEMRATGVPENTDALVALIDTIRGLNPWTKIVFTLSPLPLTRAVCDYPVTVADAISKATLRCALHEITMLKLKDIYYFPSYEILRGLGTLVDVIWNDGYTISHIRKEWTDYALSKFLAAYCEGEQGLPPPLSAR